MAIPVSNLPFIPTATPDVSPATTSTPAPTSTSTAGDASPFQTVLAAAQTPSPADAPAPEADVTETGVIRVELDTETEFDATLTTESSLAGLLAFVTQTLAPPENAAVAQATGQAAELAAATAAPGGATAAQAAQLPTDVRSRADQLRLDRGAALPNANAPEIPTGAPATATARANTFFATDATAVEAVPVANPNPAATPAAVAVRVATTAPNGGSSIPAQAPIVANLIPPVPTPANLSVEAPPVSEPTAAVAASALPSAGLGERPATAGEQFVADATAGARLAAPAPSSVMFSNTLAAEVAPAPVAPTMTVPATPVDSVPAPSGGVAPTSVSLTPVAVAPVAAEVTTGEPDAVATFGRAVADIARFVARANTAAPTTFAGALATEVNVARLPVDTTLPVAVSVVSSKPDEPTPAIEPSVNSAAVAGAPLPAAPVARPTVSETTAARVSPAAQIADTIVTHARVLERDGGVEFQMRLDPPELGPLQIKLVTRGNEVHGQVLVADEAVRGMIESQLPELRQRLEAAGVNVQRFEVSADASGNGGRNAYRDAAQEFAPRQQVVASVPRARVGRAASGTLDVTV